MHGGPGGALPAAASVFRHGHDARSVSIFCGVSSGFNWKPKASEALDRFRQLVKADKDGRLVARPCKMGDTLFRVFAGEILEHKVRNMRYLAIQERWDIDTTPFCPYVESSIGKTIFLTHEEAERALMER